jgi:hypothetical protein
VRRLSAVVQLFRLLANPLVIILLVASAIAVLCDSRSALIIVTMVAPGVAINFCRTVRSRRPSSVGPQDPNCDRDP